MRPADAIESAFEGFMSDDGYSRACRFLATDCDRWVEFDEYREAIRGAVLAARERLGGAALVGADLACGEYAWLARQFREEFHELYLLDRSVAARDATKSLQGDGVHFFLGDASEILPQLPGVDFVYAGFSFYREFVSALKAALEPSGSFFVMVPVDGDDLRWREQVSGRTLADRALELLAIESELRRHFTVSSDERSFHWVFAESEIPRLVAASAVVCFGWDRLSTGRIDDLTDIVRSLVDRVDGGAVTLSQKAVLWHGRMT